MSPWAVWRPPRYSQLVSISAPSPLNLFARKVSQDGLRTVTAMEPVGAAHEHQAQPHAYPHLSLGRPACACRRLRRNSSEEEPHFCFLLEALGPKWEASPGTGTGGMLHAR